MKVTSPLCVFGPHVTPAVVAISCNEITVFELKVELEVNVNIPLPVPVKVLAEAPSITLTAHACPYVLPTVIV